MASSLGSPTAWVTPERPGPSSPNPSTGILGTISPRAIDLDLLYAELVRRGLSVTVVHAAPGDACT